MDLSKVYNPDHDAQTRTELDSHADTCVAGANTVPLWFTEQHVSVSPFIGEYKPLKNIPIASVATAWDDPANGSTVILVINEALYFGDRMPYSLLCPNQLRHNGVTVNDTPKVFDSASSHSITLPGKLNLPLRMRGVISYLPTRKPTKEELDKCEHFELTSAQSWHPHNFTCEMTDEGSFARENARICREPLELTEGLGPRLIQALETHVHEMEGGCHEADVIAHSHELYMLKSDAKQSMITKESLAQRWFIGLEAANRTLTASTQEGMRFVEGPIERRLRTSQAHMRFPSLVFTLYSDTLFSHVRSVRGFTCAQIFTDGHGFVRVYPMKGKSEAHHALMHFIHDVGVPRDLLTDQAPEEMRGEWGQIVKKYRIRQKTTEAHSPWQNRAEAEIRELKKTTRRVLRAQSAPAEFWCYAMEWAARIRSLTAHDSLLLGTRTPEERITGRTPDISEFAHFSWFQWIWYRDTAMPFPQADVHLGRWIGVAQDVGQAMTYWILTRKGTVIARSSIAPLSDVDLRSQVVQEKMNAFIETCSTSLSNSTNTNFKPIDIFPEIIDGDEVNYSTPEADDFTPDGFDEYLSAQVILPVGGELRRGQVTRRLRDANGNPLGTRNTNPLLDTREYEVNFPDGSSGSYLANVIAENIYAQVDQEGRSYTLLDEIIDHEVDPAIDGVDLPRFTTRGWRFLVAWKDGSSSYVPLKEMKNTYPVETADYAIRNRLDEKPAFRWWVPHVTKRRHRLIGKLKKGKTKYWSRTHKYGIELPKSVTEALEIDRRTGTSYWRDAIDKEMKNVSPAFKFMDDDKAPIGYKHITCHMIFDVKMVGLVRKARFVAGGHLTDPPVESVYSSVVTRESVRIMFLVAALNDLQVLGADVQNAYINAKTGERVYTTAGPEFGSNEGRPAIIVRALYGLKSSGARWRDHLAMILMQAGFKNSKADPDVWMRKAQKSNGFFYWEYVLCYVDDILAISHDPQGILNVIAKKVTLKPGSIEEPKSYLGANISKCTILDGNNQTAMKQVWTMSAQEYIKRAVEEVERELKAANEFLPKKIETPLSSGYRPELDFSEELCPQKTNYYQGLIGILRWIVELGRIDIIVPVSLLSRYLVSPRKGHLQQAYRIFAYLKQFNRPMLVFDDSEPKLPIDGFNLCDWSSLYPNAAERIPQDAPEPLGHSVVTTCYVDADHAGCRVTRRSHTGILIYVNCAPIIWYSKRQNTIESSTFGSEFIALKISVELIESLRYKLRMFGIPVDNSTIVFCDNEAVVQNVTRPESTLKKKHISIAYHRCREAQAAGYIKIGFIKGMENLADLLTKTLPGPRLRKLMEYIFHWKRAH